MTRPLDAGPFFQGTIADLRAGDLLTAGRRSNYRPEIVMNRVYLTARVDGTGLAPEIAAELAGGDPVPRVYGVERSGRRTRRDHQLTPVGDGGTMRSAICAAHASGEQSVVSTCRS